MRWVRGVRLAFALLVVGAAGVATAFAATVPGSSSSSSVVATTVTVKGTDSRVSISPRSFAKGTVTFRITNSGSKTHVFVVAGKRTTVRSHRRATARIVFRSAGRFTWTWKGGGKAITGKLTVTGGGGGGGGGGSTSTSTTTTTTTTSTTTTTTSTTTTTTPPPTTCTSPTATIAVGMVEYSFQLSPTSVPAGCIQFVITNKGIEQHNFDLVGKKAGMILAPGTTESWNVQLTAGTYTYVCDVPFHVDRGMTGQMTVT